MPDLALTVGQEVKVPDVLLEDGNIFEGVIEKLKDDMVQIDNLSSVPIQDISNTLRRRYTLTWREDDKAFSYPLVIKKKLPDAIIGKIVVEERRETLRCRCDVDMEFHAIDEAELSSVAETILSHVNTMMEPESDVEDLLRSEDAEDSLRIEVKMIRCMMEKISHQLEGLTNALTGKTEHFDGDQTIALEVLDCSSCGLGFRHNARIEPGTFIKIRLTFKTIPQMLIESVGVVTRSVPRKNDKYHPDHFTIGVRHTHIAEADRERIIRHIFKVQRNLLRNRRSNV